MDELKLNFLYKGKKSLLDFVNELSYTNGKWDGWIKIGKCEIFIENKSFQTIIYDIISTVENKETPISLNIYKLSRDFFKKM